MTTEREIGEIVAAFKKIEVEVVREEAKKEAIGLNLKEGSIAYVAFTVLRMGEAAGVTELSTAAISEIARRYRIEGKTKNGKKTKMDSRAIWQAMRKDAPIFIQKEDGTYSLADELKEKTKKTTEREIGEIVAAFEKINVEVVREEAKKEAIGLNLKVGSGAYIAFTVLRMVKELGVTELSPTAISEIARRYRIEGKTKNGKKKKMDSRAISWAMGRDAPIFIQKGGGTYSLADKLKKKTRKTTTTKKKNTGRNKHLVEHVKRENWDLTKYGDVGFYGNEEEWCPLCDGRTVVRAASSYVMFYSNVLLWATTQELLIERFGMKIKREHVKKVLDRFFEDNQGANQKVFNFNSFCREKAELCFHCNQKLCEWIHSIQD
jgi:Asp/Glu/hydantoin racemase